MRKVVMLGSAIVFVRLYCQSFAAIAEEKVARPLTWLTGIGWPTCFKVDPIRRSVSSSIPVMKLLGSMTVGTWTACTMTSWIVLDGDITQ